MLDKHYLTPLFAPSSVVVLAGRADAPETLTPQAAADTGLAPGTPVAFGGGDQPMAMLGNGLLEPGNASVTLGTAGQVCVPTPVLR